MLLISDCAFEITVRRMLVSSGEGGTLLFMSWGNGDACTAAISE